MVESITTSSPVPVNGSQNTVDTEQKRVQTRPDEQESVQQAAKEDSVTIRSDSADLQADATKTNIKNADQAQQAARRIVELFQEKPELAATAQGGQLTPEKANAYLAQNIGG